MDVGGDNHPPARHFVADRVGRKPLALGDVFHLFGDPPLPPVMHLRADLVACAPRYPFLSHNAPILPEVHLEGGIMTVSRGTNYTAKDLA